MSFGLDPLHHETILDVALRLQLHDAWHRNPPAPSLASVFANVAAPELEAASRKARALLACAYEYGDEALSARHRNYPELVQRLSASHPGFSESSYIEVIGYGCFLAK